MVGWFQSTTNFVLAVCCSSASVDRESCLEEGGIALVARRRNEPEEDAVAAASAMWKTSAQHSYDERGQKHGW